MLPTGGAVTNFCSQITIRVTISTSNTILEKFKMGFDNAPKSNHFYEVIQISQK